MKINDELGVRKELAKFRYDNRLPFRKMAEEVNEFIPADYQLSHTTFSIWEKGKVGVNFFVMYYLANEAKGKIQDLAKLVMNMMLAKGAKISK